MLPSENRRQKILTSAGFILCHVLYELPAVLKCSTAGSTHDAVEKASIMSATESYAGAAVKIFITAGGPPRRGPSSRKLAGCLKTISQSPGGD